MRLRGLVLGALVLCLIPLAAQPAAAESIIFNGNSGGSVAYAGGGVALIGSSIAIATVKGDATPLNAGTWGVTGGMLNFTTGVLSSYASGVYTFGSGGSINLTGAGPGGSGPNLLMGSFLSAEVNTNTGMIKFLLAFGPDTKDPNLLSFFGYTPLTPFEFGATINLFPFTGGGGGAFSGTANTTQITNVRVAVPEPASLALLGAGLIGLAAFLRRRGFGSLAARS